MGKPNIVLIVMDTARAKDISCYGYEKETTPFLDELAERSIKFERCIPQSPWTLPSHASLFSGKYPHEVGVQCNGDSFSYGENLGEMLRNKGYNTIAISNNGYISSDFGMDLGFDRFVFNPINTLFEDADTWEEITDTAQASKYSSNWEKFVDFSKKCLRKLDGKSVLNAAFYLLTNGVYRFLEGDDGAEMTFQKVKDMQLEQPFFLFINYVEPHSTYTPPKDFAKKYTTPEEREKYGEYVSEIPWKLSLKNKRILEEGKDFFRSMYGAEINYLDSKIEELYGYLEEVVGMEDTIFIVTSDHGESFGEHDIWEHHGGVYQEVLHVPLIIDSTREDDRDVEGIFELKNLYDLILEMASGDGWEIENSEFGLCVYSGIESHILYDEETEKGKSEVKNSLKNDRMYAVVKEDRKKISWSSGKEEVWGLRGFYEVDIIGGGVEVSDGVTVNFDDLEYKKEGEEDISEEVKKRLKDLGYM